MLPHHQKPKKHIVEVCPPSQKAELEVVPQAGPEARPQAEKAELEACPQAGLEARPQVETL